MPAKKAKAKNKILPEKNKKRFYQVLPYWKVIFICGLLIAVFTSLAWLFDADKPAPEVHGTAFLTDKQLQSLSAHAKYQDLDLRVAALAIYKGAPLQVARDLGSIDGVHQQEIKFTVYAANLTEYGLMTLPASPRPADGYPVIILCHGYVNPARYSTTKAYLYQMEYYSQHGFAVVKPDFRGQGLSTKAGKPEGAYYSMAYNVDVLSLIASLKQTGYLNKNKINVWGHSMGGYIALRAAVLSPDIKNVILLSAPVGNIQDMFSSYIPPSDRANPTALLIRSNLLSQYDTPVANPSFWNNTSPLNFLDKTKAYIQIHVGEKDRTVPPKFSAELDNALNKQHQSHDYYAYASGGHGLGPQMALVLQRSLVRLQSSN